MPSWIFIVLAHWNNSSQHVTPLGHIILDSEYNQSFLLLLSAARFTGKQQIPGLLSLVWPDRGSNPCRSTPLEASMLTITPLMFLLIKDSEYVWACAKRWSGVMEWSRVFKTPLHLLAHATCVRGIDLASVSMIFLLDFGIAPTVRLFLVFHFFLLWFNKYLCIWSHFKFLRKKLIVRRHYSYLFLNICCQQKKY